MNPTPPQAAGSLNRFLNAIEAAGNKLPHITMLFIWALVITLVISLALFLRLVRLQASVHGCRDRRDEHACPREPA